MNNERLVTRAHTVAEILRDRGHSTAAQVIYQLLDFVPGGKMPREIDHWVFCLECNGNRRIALGSDFLHATDTAVTVPHNLKTYLEDEGFTVIHMERLNKPVYAHN